MSNTVYMVAYWAIYDISETLTNESSAVYVY